MHGGKFATAFLAPQLLAEAHLDEQNGQDLKENGLSDSQFLYPRLFSPWFYRGLVQSFDRSRNSTMCTPWLSVELRSF